MNKIEEGFLRLCLRPRVTCDLPGRLRLCFEKYRLLPDAAATDARTILDWVDTVVDEGIRMFREGVWKNKGETELEEIARRRLILRLPQQKEGKV